MSDSASTTEFFDPAFLSELETLVNEGEGAAYAAAFSLHEKLAAFLRGPDGRLSEEEFAALPAPALSERTNELVEICRDGRTEAVPAVENFVVFFQALVPTLGEDGARQVTRIFYRLAPTLLHVAYNDFGESQEARREGASALRDLESILLEISSIKLAPSECELVFKSIDHMSSLIAVGEYGMASGLISSQLLGIIQRNRLARALYRIMEVEVEVQRYLKEKRGYPTPQVRLPEDVTALADYGPVRILHEEFAGETRRFLQFQIPDIPILRDVVVHLVAPGSTVRRVLRLDRVGTVALDVPDGTYEFGLVYEPEGR